jgi:uncharacterized membrane protein
MAIVVKEKEETERIRHEREVMIPTGREIEDLIRKLDELKTVVDKIEVQLINIMIENILNKYRDIVEKHDKIKKLQEKKVYDEVIEIVELGRRALDTSSSEKKRNTAKEILERLKNILSKLKESGAMDALTITMEFVDVIKKVFGIT